MERHRHLERRVYLNNLNVQYEINNGCQVLNAHGVNYVTLHGTSV
jgi:hypothetical protein